MQPETLINLWVAEHVYGLAAQPAVHSPEDSRVTESIKMQLAEDSESYLVE